MKRLPIAAVGLALAVGVTIGVVIVNPLEAFADEMIDSCGALSTSGTTYELTEDISSAGTCFIVTGDTITLDCAGHTITGDGSGTGVQVGTSSGVTVKDCTITSFSNGIVFELSDGGAILGNTTYGNHHEPCCNSAYGDGIELIGGQDNVIEDNAVHDNDWGIVLDVTGDRNTIRGNVVEMNREYGITVGTGGGGDQNVIDSNDVRLNGTGIYVSVSSEYNTIDGNMVSDNDSAGIEILSSYNTVTGNHIHSNGCGVCMGLESTSGNLIYNNIFANGTNAGDGGGTNTWSIAPNPGTNIVGGHFLGGNFWSDYTGIDLDRDGLGDTQLPYDAAGNIQNGGDFEPLVVPVGGIAQLPDMASTPLETGDSAGSNWGLAAAIAAAATAGLVGLGSAAWYARRRGPR